MELINNLFPQNSIDAAIKLLKVRRDLENSIPLYLNDYGFCKLGKSNDNYSADIIVNNITINVLSGEALLRYVFQDSLQHIIEHMKTKVNDMFESDHNNSSAISDTS